MSDIGSFLPPVFAELRANNGEFMAKMKESRGEAKLMASEGSNSFNQLATVGKGALLGLGAAIIGVSILGVEMADKWEASHARLETAIKNTDGTFEEFKGRVDGLNSRSEKYGYTNAEVESSLARLVPATHNTKKAIDEMSLAEDIARGRHIDLQAATDILVKVESGRVSMLGRLGISVKDATGATISQEEALKRLSGLYGGQASAYSETFAGKMQALKATSEDLAKSWGLMVIPVIQKGATLFADGTQFLVEHRTAAIALAVVIGGPLVIAMGAYIVKATIALALNVASGWMTMVSAGRTLMLTLQGMGTAMEGWAGASSLAAAANAAGTASLGGAAAGFGALVVGATVAAAAVALPVAAIMGTAYALGYFNDKVSEGTKLGDALAINQIKQARATGDTVTAYEMLKRQYDETTVSLKAGDKVVGNLQDWQARHISHDQAHSDALTYDKSLDGLRAQHEKLGEAVAKLHPEYAKLHAEHEAAVITTKAVAKATGVEIPNAASMSSTALKAMQKAVKDSTAEFGPLRTQALLDLGETGAGIDDLVKKAQALATAVGASMDKSTDAFSHFGSQASVSEWEMEKFFVGSIKQSADWATEVQDLIHRGVDQGIVAEMAKAGPDSKPALDAFTAMVNQHGVDWVNEWAAKGADAKTVMVNAMADMQFAIEQRLAELRKKAAETPITPVVDTSPASIALGRLDQQISDLLSRGDTAGAYFGELARDSGQYQKTATGGIFNVPQVRMFAEAGPEAVLPLNDPTRAWDLIRQSGLMDSAASGGSSRPIAAASLSSASMGAPRGGDTTIVVHAQSNANPDEIARAMSWAAKTSGR